MKLLIIRSPKRFDIQRRILAASDGVSILFSFGRQDVPRPSRIPGVYRRLSPWTSVLECWWIIIHIQQRIKPHKIVGIYFYDLRLLHPRPWRRKLADLRLLAQELKVPVVALVPKGYPTIK